MSSTVKISSALLNDAISIARRWIPSRPIIQATSGFLFEFRDSEIAISASDASGSDVSVTVQADFAGEPCAILVDAKRLFNTISVMVKVSDSLELVVDESGITVKCPGHSTKIQSMRLEDFPELQRDISGEAIEASAKQFSRAVSITRISVDPMNPRYQISGIRFDNDEAVTTDGHRLSVVRGIRLASIPLTLPAIPCLNVAASIGKDDDPLVATYDAEKEKILLELGDVIVSMAVMTYPYPDYTMMLPDSHKSYFSVRKDGLISSLSLAGAFAAEIDNMIVLTINEGKLTIESHSDTGKSTSEMDMLSFEGEETTAYLSYKYLKDAVSNIDDIVHIGLGDDRRVIIVENDTDYVCGIMPMSPLSAHG